MLLPSVIATQLLLIAKENKTSIDRAVKSALEPYRWDIISHIELLEDIDKELGDIDLSKGGALPRVAIVALKKIKRKYLLPDEYKELKNVPSDAELAMDLCAHFEGLAGQDLFRFKTATPAFFEIPSKALDQIEHVIFEVDKNGWCSDKKIAFGGLDKLYSDRPCSLLGRRRFNVIEKNGVILVFGGDGFGITTSKKKSRELGFIRDGLPSYPVSLLSYFFKHLKITTPDSEGHPTTTVISVIPFKADRKPLSFMKAVFDEWDRRIKAKSSFKCLVQGSPGSGKTASILSYARRLDMPVLYTTPDSGESSLLALSAESLNDEPSIVIIDDVDRFAPDLVDSLLHLIDHSNKIVFLTSNNIRKLSLAFRRPGRLDQVLQWGRPIIQDAFTIWDDKGAPFELNEDHESFIEEIIHKSDLAGLDLYLDTLKSIGPDFHPIDGDITFSQPTSLDDDEVYDG